VVKALPVFQVQPAPPALAGWLTRLLAPVVAACQFRRAYPIELRPTGCFAGWALPPEYAPDRRVSVSTRMLHRSPRALAGIFLHEVAHQLVGAEHDHDAAFFATNLMLLLRVSESVDADGGKRWWRSGTRRQELYTAPRMFEIAEAGTASDFFAFSGAPMKVIGMELPAASVGRWLGDDSPPLNLARRQERFDDEVADLLVMLWRDATDGGMRGRLYTEGLTTALLGLLSARYRADPERPKRAARLGREEQSRPLAFIASELGVDLSVERMADVVRMSPFHFSRIFKVTFEQSPHAFVLTQRLNAACAAMRREPTRPLADIAIDTGFASQAHFAETFRRKMGATPGRWRRES